MAPWPHGPLVPWSNPKCSTAAFRSPNGPLAQVSPTYAREISGNPAVRRSLGKLHGILNGIDPDIWDPLVDKFIPVSAPLVYPHWTTLVRPP